MNLRITLRRRLALWICPELVPVAVPEAWPTNWRPTWWSDRPVREFIYATHRKMLLKEVVAQGNKKFGGRFPSQSAVHRMWQRIEAVKS